MAELKAAQAAQKKRLAKLTDELQDGAPPAASAPPAPPSAPPPALPSFRPGSESRRRLLRWPSRRSALLTTPRLPRSPGGHLLPQERGGDHEVLGGSRRLQEPAAPVRGQAGVLVLRRPTVRHGQPALRPHPRRHDQGRPHALRPPDRLPRGTPPSPAASRAPALPAWRPALVSRSRAPLAR